eukprot:gene47407-61531_t
MGLVIPEMLYSDISADAKDGAIWNVVGSLRHNTWQVLRFFLTYQSGEKLEPTMNIVTDMEAFKDDAEAVSALAQIVDALQ